MCVFNASGPDFDVDAYLRTSPFQPVKVYRRGEPRVASRPEGRVNEKSGFNVRVSDADWATLDGQVADALVFLAKNRGEIERLGAIAGVALTLDFAVDQRIGIGGVMVQTDSFPPPLVRAAGELGIGLALSIFWPAEEE